MSGCVKLASFSPGRLRRGRITHGVTGDGLLRGRSRGGGGLPFLDDRCAGRRGKDGCDGEGADGEFDIHTIQVRGRTLPCVYEFSRGEILRLRVSEGTWRHGASGPPRFAMAVSRTASAARLESPGGRLAPDQQPCHKSRTERRE